MADGELSEEDAAALLRLRVLLCIPHDTVEAAHLDICGSLFGKVLCFSFSLLLIGYTYQIYTHTFIDKVIMCLHLCYCFRLERQSCVLIDLGLSSFVGHLSDYKLVRMVCG